MTNTLPARLSNPRHVMWIGGFFIIVILAMSVYDIVRSYYRTVDNTGNELDAQARTIAEQTAQSIQAVDVVLRHLAQQFRQGEFVKMSSWELHAYLREQAVGLAPIDGLSLRDANGVALATSWIFPTPPSGVNVADRGYFQVLRDNPDAGLHVGSAIQSRIAAEWVFPISRRLENAAGEFAGIVAARGRIDYFQNFYRDIQLDPGTKVTLMHQDATMVARHPATPASLGKHFPLFAQTLASSKEGKSARTRTVSPVDGIERFGAMRVVHGYPLAVIVTRDVSVALAPWRQQARGSILRTLALGGLAALLLVVVRRQLSRLTAARASLETSEERYALAVAGSNDGIWDWDYSTGKCFASERAREILGLQEMPEAQSIAEWFRTLDQQIHPDDAPARRAAMEAHLSGRTPTYECEYRVRNPDGGYRWVRSRGMCVRRGTQKPHRMAGSVTDIDAAKRAQEALRESEERFSLAVAGSNDGILDWDIVHDRMFTSRRAMHITGVESDVTVRPRAEWAALLKLHPDDVQRHNEDLRRHLEGQSEVREGEYRLLHPDGEYRWVLVRGTSVRDANGRPIRWAGSVSNIDARKRAEEALRRSEERFSLAVSGSNDGIVDWDVVNDRMYSSERAMQILGIESGVTVRTRAQWSALVKYHPDDMQRMKDDLNSFLEGHTELRDGEYRVLLPNGDYRWIRHRNKCVRDSSGRPIRVAGSVSDIDPQKRAERERLKLESQLLQAKKLEAIGTLAGGIAHDFNNILAAILGYGEMAQKDAAEGTALKRHLDAIVSAGMRAKSLVERILAFSRSGIGERVPVHMQSVVTEALDLVSASLPGHVRLERCLDTGDSAVMGDPTQIHQVVLNLCTNGAQAIKSPGVLTVTLEVVEREETMAATSSLPRGRYACLRVSDTGSGIPANVLERIFDPFFTTKDVGVGTGLGLSLVHGIVTDLGGGIDVESAASTGTKFSVYLPLTRAAAVPAVPDDIVPEGTGQTVLLVDDEETLVRLGEEMIATLGYEPVGFTSCKAALQAFRETPERFQAVLSDESMPEMTGSALAAEIRRIRSDLPIVLMSGYVTPALIARARELDVCEVLTKPLVSRDIARALAVALKLAESGQDDSTARASGQLQQGSRAY